MRRIEPGLGMDSLRDLLRLVFRHRTKMLAALLVAITLGLAASFLTTPVYRSEAQLLVRVGRESVALDPTAVMGPRVAISQSRKEEIRSELAILRSEDLMVQMAAAENAGRCQETQLPSVCEEEASLEKAAASLADKMRAHVLPSSNVIALHFDDEDRAHAQSMLELWVQRFLEKHVEVHRTPGSYEFFSEQTDNLAQRIAETNRELTRLQWKSGDFVIAERRKALVDQIVDLRKQESGVDLSIETLKARIAVLKAQTPSDELLDKLKERLVDAKLAKLELAGRYKEGTAAVDAADNQVKGTVGLLKQVGRERRLQMLKGARGELAVEMARREALAKQLVSLREELAQFAEKDQAIDLLLRRKEADQANYDKYIASLEQARIDSALERARISNISVLQAPTLPQSALHPRPTVYFAASTLLGLFLALALGIGAEALDPSLRTPQRVKKKLGVRCLGSIPFDESMTTLKLLNDAHIGVPVQEALDQLAGQLMATGVRIVAVAGSREGDGASTLVAGLARRISASKVNALVIDADAMERKLTASANLTGAVGLSELLSGARTVPEKIAPRLALLPAGNAISPTLSHTQLVHAQEMMKTLRADPGMMVLVDLGDVVANRSRAALASLCDEVILVVDAEHTRWQIAAAAIDALQTRSAMLAGIVLNRRRYPIPDFLYRRT